MEYRYLGKQRLKVSALGYGCPTFVGTLSDVAARFQPLQWDDIYRYTDD
jgi:aryl-alcohol dehydrogenase-like predicted oxidoreductase